MEKFLNRYSYLYAFSYRAFMPDISDNYGKDHGFTCPHCGHRWRTTETTPKLHCKKCNRYFPNPWAEPDVAK
jgi:ribosomal protein L37AE/L43A